MTVSAMSQEYTQALRHFCHQVEFYCAFKQANPELAKVSPTDSLPL